MYISLPQTAAHTPEKNYHPRSLFFSAYYKSLCIHTCKRRRCICSRSLTAKTLAKFSHVACIFTSCSIMGSPRKHASDLSTRSALFFDHHMTVIHFVSNCTQEIPYKRTSYRIKYLRWKGHSHGQKWYK